mmetsp:Transcript_10976/g.30784  ORF Transcript_10976/g.30784 Transcript_10976/m.30784 type:complete len:93 (-) Transcript_10976:120-398(-)
MTMGRDVTLESILAFGKWDNPTRLSNIISLMILSTHKQTTKEKKTPANNPHCRNSAPEIGPHIDLEMERIVSLMPLIRVLDSRNKKVQLNTI